MAPLYRAYESISDARDAPVGTFAGTTTADALTVGSYGNVARTGREAAGTFAGDPDEQRRGSFGDSYRPTVTTSASGEAASVIDDQQALRAAA